jgi:hypothetical protein
MGFREKVRVSVENNFAILEDGSFKIHLRWVFAFLRSDIADIVRPEIDIGEFERTVLALIYIGKLTAGDDEFIDVERVDCLDCVLPASLFDRGFVFYFIFGLLEVEKQLRVIYFEIRHHVAGEQSPPINACA